MSHAPRVSATNGRDHATSTNPVTLLLRWFPTGLPRATLGLRILLFALLIMACAVRVWAVFGHNPIDAIWSDPGRHWTLGTRPLDTQPFAAIDPLGYHVYIAVLAKMTAGAPILVAYWTALLSLATPWIWYRFLRELLPSRDWALAGWVVLAAMPSWSAIYSYFMQETLALPLLGAALWATWRSRRKRDTRSFLVAVVLWTCAGLTRGICIPLAAVSMCWLWLTQGDRTWRAVWSLVILAGVLAPLAGRSWYIARQVSPHGIGSMNSLYSRAGSASITVEFTRRGGKEYWINMFQSPSIGERPLAPLSDWKSTRLGNASFKIDLDAGRRDWVAARSSLPPWTLRRYLWLTGDNLVHLSFGSSWPDSNRERWLELANYRSRWLWVPLAVVCLAGTVRLRKRSKEWLLPALLVTWFVVQGLVPLAVNEGRYRKPFEGMLIAQCLLLASLARTASVPARDGRRRVRTEPAELASARPAT